MTKQSIHVHFLTVAVECSTRANTCTHIHREHLKVILVCPICDNPMLSMVLFKTHMKQVHTGVQEAVQEASGGPLHEKIKNSGLSPKLNLYFELSKF